MSNNLLKEITQEIENNEANVSQFQLFDLNKRPQSTKRLVWRVFIVDNNLKTIKAINIFNLNGNVNARIYEATKTIHNFKEWEKSISNILREFWSRFQYEIQITDLLNSPDTSIKIDVWTQITINWDHFIRFLWNNKAIVLEELKEYYDSYRKTYSPHLNNH